MVEPTVINWILAIFGTVTFVPLLVAQMVMILNPSGQKAKDILIGKGGGWRDKTHFKSALAFAWADWLVIMPLLVAGNTGVLLGQMWGYVVWIVLGAISVYFSIVFWILEKEIVYPANGPLKYYTFVWGNFLYWGLAALVFGIFRLSEVL